MIAREPAIYYEGLSTGTAVPEGHVDAAGLVHRSGCACLTDGHCAIELDLHQERLLAEAIANDELIETMGPDGVHHLVRGSTLRD